MRAFEGRSDETMSGETEGRSGEAVEKLDIGGDVQFDWQGEIGWPGRKLTGDTYRLKLLLIRSRWTVA